MKRRITRGFAVAATAAVAGLLLAAPVQAAQPRAVTYYGAYQDQGTCNYWKYAVAATGKRTHACFYDGGWWFYTY